MSKLDKMVLFKKKEWILKRSLKDVLPFAEAFSRLLHPFAEVVVHDLGRDQIEAIYNPLSRREVGDDSYLDQIDFDGSEMIIGPYEKTNWDGRLMKSISIVIRNQSGKAEGFLCINLDISVFETANQLLQTFLKNNVDTVERTQRLFKDDLYEKINQYVQNYSREHQVSMEAFSRVNKKEIIDSLVQEGAFRGKNAANYIGRVLGISRATVYNYLKEKEEAPMTKRYKNIIFDLGAVLFHWSPKTLVEFLSKQDASTPPNLMEITQSSSWRRFDLGLLSLEQVVEECSPLFPKQHVERFIKTSINHFIPLPQGIELFEKVRLAGYDTYILSNLPVEFHRHIQENFEFIQHFTGSIFSYQVNVAKPDPEIYLALLKKYNLSPVDCLFIDDAEPNINAARSLEIDGLHCLEHAEVKKKLEALGIVSKERPRTMRSS